MRVGCGSATIGMFAAQWRGLVDEVVVVDDHITGVVSEHQAGKVLGWEDTGIKIIGRRSTPGRYFKVSEPGLGWGGTTIRDPAVDPRRMERQEGRAARPVAADGVDHGRAIRLLRAGRRAASRWKSRFPSGCRKSVGLIEENCEPALCTVLFVGGAGGSLRAGVVENPVNLTRSVQGLKTYVTVGGAPVYVWPGGGITLMVDVMRVPEDAFGYVPTPALVAPIEFTLAPRRLCSRSAATRPRSGRSRTCWPRAANISTTAARRSRHATTLAAACCSFGHRRRHDAGAASALAAGRQAASPQSWADRPDRRGVRSVRQRWQAQPMRRRWRGSRPS